MTQPQPTPPEPPSTWTAPASSTPELSAHAPSTPEPGGAAGGASGTAVPWAGLRIGEGWDCHALVPGRVLVLGGVTIPHTHGLLGHSDADVLLHAVTDAVLGAAGLGDIGRHFPDTDPRFRGADSQVLLAEAMRRVREAGCELINLDCTVVAQAPKLAPHIEAMAQGVAKALGVGVDQVNVKAKTAERLGPVGQGLSMEARAVVLMHRAAGAVGAAVAPCAAAPGR